MRSAVGSSPIQENISGFVEETVVKVFGRELFKAAVVGFQLELKCLPNLSTRHADILVHPRPGATKNSLPFPVAYVFTGT